MQGAEDAWTPASDDKGEPQEPEEAVEEQSAEHSGGDESSSDDNSEEQDSPGAQERALKEARAMLKDRRRDRRGHFFEEEVPICLLS